MFAAEATRRIAIVGSSGHCSTVVDALRCLTSFSVIGLFDDFAPAGTERNGYPVLGCISDIAEIAADQVLSGIIVAVGDNWMREQISVRVRQLWPAAAFVTAVHDRAYVALTGHVGQGVVLAAGAIVGPNCRVADGCIVNTAATVDHDCELAAYASIAPGAHLGGRVFVGTGSAVGIGATVLHQVSIGSNTVIGAGAVVLSDLPSDVVAYGVPARIVRSRKAGEPYL